jgi:hypothetical protein
MPWWGWLIAFCVVAVCLTVLRIVRMVTLAIRYDSFMSDLDRSVSRSSTFRRSQK